MMDLSGTLGPAALGYQEYLRCHCLNPGFGTPQVLLSIGTVTVSVFKPWKRTGPRRTKKEKTMTTRATTVVMKEEFRNCPSCGYRDGFHTMLQENGIDLRWLFICPSCHEVFDIGCRVPRPSG